jgi:hypothetical protein
MLLVQNCALVSLLHPPVFEDYLLSDGGEVSPKIIQSTTELAELDINPSDLKMP